ncbi:F-box/kelch-repeat protein At3g44120-like [Lolium perenne]|uniref:F-box/kelch-repeat protein At3g44120-like n=1 Tax=Lolium perenne TaxID=4522 RepID=UPI0021F5F936|nr:uncharacterized protein LOC127303625 [Lolium perenne]
MAASPSKSMPTSPYDGGSRLHGALLVDEILTRLPAAAAVRFRSVCRAWKEALTSDHFVTTHAARAAAARQPEILFFPPAEGSSTSFYTCSLPPEGEGSPPAAARRLLTVRNLAAEYVVLSRKPCRGLTLVMEASSSEYYVFNLSTGDHVALPPCEPAQACGNLYGRFLPLSTPWTPFEFSSAGLGFDPATGEHKAVRLFLISGKQRQFKCDVYTMGSAGGWRPCAGDVPPDVHGYFLAGLPPVTVDGSFYWLLTPSRDESVEFKNTPILSFSVGAEQFGWVHMPPGLRKRVRHLAELDGSLCAVVHGLHHRFRSRNADRVIKVLTWNGGTTSSWRTRCRIELDSLPRPISKELDEEKLTIIPLCTTAGGKILLATGRHKVFAYDAERNSVHKVFSMYDYVDFPVCHTDARLLINIFLHEERIVGVPKPPVKPPAERLHGIPKDLIKPGQTCLRCHLFGENHCRKSLTQAAAAPSTSLAGRPRSRGLISPAGLHVTLGGHTVGRREKHRSDESYAYFIRERWTKQWTPALRNCLPNVMSLE